MKDNKPYAGQPAPPLWTSLTDGEGHQWSWSRLTCTVILFFTLGWGSYIVSVDKRIPDFSSVALLIGAIYGVNRVAEWQEKKPPEPPPTPPQQTANVSIDTK